MSGIQNGLPTVGKVLSNAVQSVRRIVVAPSAQLDGVRGPVGAREKMAFSNSKKILNEAFDIFERKNELTQGDISELMQKNLPDVNVAVHRQPEFSDEVAVMNISYNEGVGWHRYDLLLPFSRNKKGEYHLKKNKIGSFAHELQHLNDYAHNPCFIARQEREAVLPTEIRRDASDFYHNFLYAEDIFSGFHFINKQPFIQKQRAKSAEKNINKFFAMYTFEPKDRVAILQSWRTGLRSEHNANLTQEATSVECAFRNYEASHSSLSDAQIGLKERLARKSQSRMVDGVYAFDTKIDVINKMLKRELQKARAGRKAT